MNFKAAIFDMDGTLVDSLSFWGYHWRRMGQRYFSNPDFYPDTELDKKIRTSIFKDAMIEFKRFYRIEGSEEEFLAFAEGGILDFYRDVAKPKEGAFALLDALRARGIKLCLASATEKSAVLFALSCYGLLDYFPVVLSCADIGVGKDKPDVYLEAVRQLGVEVSEACVFEDSFLALETARRAGFSTVGIFDKHNYSHDRLRAASDVYLSCGESLEALIPRVLD